MNDEVAVASSIPGPVVEVDDDMGLPSRIANEQAADWSR